MLRTEYEMLTFIHQNPGCSWTDVLNGFDPEHKCQVTNAVMNCLLEQRMISIFPPTAKPPVCAVRLSPSSVHLILLYEEEQQKQAEETAKLEKRIQEQHELEARRIQEQHELEERRIREQRRWERQSLLISGLIGVLGAVLGAVFGALLTFFFQHF